MTAQNFELTAADGYRLAATHFKPDSGEHSNGAPQFIVIASATAVPRGFYRRFAEFAAARGINVVTTDYRGIGDSKYVPLRGFDMEYADWSRLDLAAAVQWATERGRTWLVGHSLAAHAIGQLPRPNDLQAAYVCGGGAGWHGWMPYPERMKVWLMWNALGPIATRIYGYQPMSKFGMGEDLPMGVYRDWRRWCQLPNYFFDDQSARLQRLWRPMIYGLHRYHAMRFSKVMRMRRSSILISTPVIFRCQTLDTWAITGPAWASDFGRKYCAGWKRTGYVCRTRPTRPL
jgi:predicted alpha/beta hydrolase